MQIILQMELLVEKNMIIKDIFPICLSFLTKDEIIYSKGNWNEFNEYAVCDIAAMNGWLPLLKWATGNGCKWYDSSCMYAAINGHLNILKWAYENKYSLNSVCTWAAGSGHLEILKWVYDEPDLWKCASKYDICNYTTKNGFLHTEVLQWVHKN